MKLGVVPDPNEVGDPDDDNQLRVSQMTSEQRESKMKEIGLVLPKRRMQEFQKKMNKMAKENYKKLMEVAESKFNKSDTKTLKKMGLSPEQIANADPNINPFEDKGLGDMGELGSAMEDTKVFYEELKDCFRAQ